MAGTVSWRGRRPHPSRSDQSRVNLGPAGTSPDSPRSSLLVVLDNLRRSCLRVVRIESCRPACLALMQQVVRLIELDADLLEPLCLGAIEPVPVAGSLPQLLLLGRELV